MTQRIAHWISGTDFTDGELPVAEVFNPATGVCTGLVELADQALVDQAVQTAQQASEIWRDYSHSARARVLFAFRQLLADSSAELAWIITAEHGKVHSDALGEVTRGLEVVEFACGASHLLKGEFTENAATKIDVHSARQPLGVVAVISPFNFPVMVPLWFAPIAIAAGNSVILKPSEKDPSAALKIAQLWSQAGLPAGVFTVLQGDKNCVEALVDHPQVKAISFVGSTPIARSVYQRGTAAGKRVQALGGAKNHMLVLPDADLDQAADAAVNAGFGSAGERCMAISVVVAVADIADELVQKLKTRIATLQIGPGDREVDLGPLITAAHRDKVASYIEAGITAGAELIADGRNPVVEAHPAGFWLGPTLLDHVTPEMSVYQDEIFGPVLTVVRVNSMAEGLKLINSNQFGNGTAIFTRDGGAAREFQRNVQVGMIGVNVSIPVPVAQYSFGGWKDSIFGDLAAYGPDGIKFFTRGKVITSRWPDNSVGGLNLGFPQNS